MINDCAEMLSAAHPSAPPSSLKTSSTDSGYSRPCSRPLGRMLLYGQTGTLRGITPQATDTTPSSEYTDTRGAQRQQEDLVRAAAVARPVTHRRPDEDTRGTPAQQDALDRRRQEPVLRHILPLEPS